MLTEPQPQPQPQLQPRPVANRSFLYGGGATASQATTTTSKLQKSDNATTSSSSSSSSCLIGQKIVYATLDGLALRRAATDSGGGNRQQRPAAQSESSGVVIGGPDLENHSSESKQQHPELTHNQSSSAGKVDGHRGYTFPGALADAEKKKQKKTSKKKKKKSGKDAADSERKRFAFAKNVLHYVPMQSRRYYRKSRKLASKSLSLKSLGVHQQQQQQEQLGTLKSRSLSRDELKYISISRPSNFVHVDSGHSLLPKLQQQANTQQLRPSEYAELALENSSMFLLNNSFLWASQQLCKLNESQNEDDDYDDVGPPVVDSSMETQECRGEETTATDLVEELKEEDEQDDVYDDVGPPSVLFEQQDDDDEEEEEKQEEELEEDQVYDDVGPLRQTDERDRESSAKQDKKKVEEDEETEQPQETYEIPQAPLSPEEENPEDALVELRQSSVDDEAQEEEDDVYDDVGPAVQPQNPAAQEAHERVNSLYSGSVQHAYDKESEWEDLDEPGDCQANPPRSKKKNGGPRWSCKLRRQRSKASRKSSARSASRNSRSAASRAIASSGGSLAEAPSSLDSDSSDDGNYETLQTYEPDDFSSDSEAEESSGSVPSLQQPSQQQQQPAPSRPIPPPPREESLGHSLGRRMKILRRTWSITKGSLGRMRRRASADVDETSSQQQTSPTAGGQYDPRKYFSFKKHFRKSLPSGGHQGLSTFYLDKSLSSEAGSSGKESSDAGNDCCNEPVYGNADWYKEVGLYAAGNGSRRESSFEQLPAMLDHYSVLAEEPLYQFYAADATRVAFESDSDGYEEVEELTPSSATTDLARPGHRTLWCQTPQVINSGLLQMLTMEERKIQEAKFEILTSEASYLNSLRVLENEFASNQELVHDLLTASEREKLFGSVPDVLVASERFLAELEGIWREDTMLGRLAELLLKHADKCAHVYVEYCSNQVNIDATLKELKAKKGYKYLEALSKIESQRACHSLSLHSFLMLPMQRITRLPLLADAVLSKLAVEHSERLSWERVLATLSQIVAKCNEGARLAERRNEMEALARKLEYPAKVAPISLRERELIRSGTVVHLSSKSDTEYKLTFGRKFHKTPLMLMLLTDYLLVTKLKSNSNEETYSVMETCKRSLVALESAPEDGPFAGRHAMVLTLLENQDGRQVDYVLTCDNDTEKERWLDAVSPPKPSCLGETLYESWDCPQVMAVYSYAPRQPDEIALQPGDVINVLRKMNDGWLFGEKLLDGEQGWFPGNFTKEVASEHVRARNLRQRHRFLALSGSVLQRKAKQSLSLL